MVSVPEVIAEASCVCEAGALPLAVPVKLAVMMFALKFPSASLSTIAPGVLVEAAVVRAFPRVPEVICEAS